jgi:hypothetical protein
MDDNAAETPTINDNAAEKATLEKTNETRTSPSLPKGFSKFLHDPRMVVNAKLNARAAGMDKGKAKKTVQQFLLEAHFTDAEVEPRF